MSSTRFIITGGDIVTMNPRREVLRGGAIVVDGSVIVAVGRAGELLGAYPDAMRVDATGCVVTPGLINGHQHLTADPLSRSCIPDDLAPGVSISEWAVPLHAHHSPDDDELSAMLHAVESLLNGVTTVVEAGTVAHPDRVASALRSVGLRGTIGTWGWDTEGGPFSAPATEVLARQLDVLTRFPRGGLVEGWVTLVGHDLASDELLAGAAELARASGVRMTMHLSPSSADPERYLARTGRRPVAHLAHLGVLGPHLLLAHGVWLDDHEIELVLDSDTALAYCPRAYLRLGQGVTRMGRHAEIVERGGRVVLGGDAANAGDTSDILQIAALASGLAKDGRLDPTRFGAHEVFELATIAGARALGLDDRIGSLEPGKQADIVVHRKDGWGWSNRADVVLQLVWGTDGRTVRDVFVDGRRVVSDGRVTTVDAPSLWRQAEIAQRELLTRAGLHVPHRWPHLDAS